MRARGCDTSSVQGQIDFQAFRRGGYQFVILKATQGARGVDPWFVRHAAAARAAGVLFGAYHFLTPTADVADQFSNIMQTIALQDPDLGIFVDFEYPAPEAWVPPINATYLATRCFDLCTRILAATSRPPCLYTYPDFAQHVGANDAVAQLARFPLWIASYHNERVEPDDRSIPTVPLPWRTWQFWQWSGNGGSRAPGIPVVVDHDLFNGTTEDLLAWCESFKGESAPPSTQPEGPAA